MAYATVAESTFTESIHSMTQSIEILPSVAWYAKVWAPAAGVLVVGPLVYFRAREAKGHGVPVFKSLAPEMKNTILYKA